MKTPIPPRAGDVSISNSELCGATSVSVKPFVILLLTLLALTFPLALAASITPPGTSQTPSSRADGWISCLDSLKLSEMGQSTRELLTREASEKILIDTLHKYLKPSGQIDLDALKKLGRDGSFDLGPPETIRLKNCLAGQPKAPRFPVDLNLKITRDSSGNILNIDVATRMGRDDLVTRIQRAVGADEFAFFNASISFDPKAGDSGNQCLISQIDGDVNFDYGYCQMLESIADQQGPCDSKCAKQMVTQFSHPTLFNPQTYESLRRRAARENDFRSLAKNIFDDLCAPVYSSYKTISDPAATSPNGAKHSPAGSTSGATR